MAKKLTKKQLENHLQHLDKKELIAEVSKLFSRIEQVREYYQMEFGGKADREAVLADYKKQIRNQFYSSRSAYPQDPKGVRAAQDHQRFQKGGRGSVRCGGPHPVPSGMCRGVHQ